MTCAPRSSSQERPGHRGPWCAFVLCLAPLAQAQRQIDPVDFTTYPAEPADPVAEPCGPPRWTRLEVEHLFNRAAFGAREQEIRQWVRKQPVELVDYLLQPAERTEPFYVEAPTRPDRSYRELSPARKRAFVASARAADRRQFYAFVHWWMERLLHSERPLAEKLTLFWHGFFTSSYDVVRRSDLMIRQNELLREHALGSYATMLREIVRDPALLLYLDNDESKKEHPNENLARELFELFSLGEGNYSERDVKEAARALTGRTVQRGEYLFDLAEHDRDLKHILGRRGNIGGNQLVDLILRNPACPRYVSGRLLEWFEGVAPDPLRQEAYAEYLLSCNYEIEPFLRRLFLDPEFYRPEILGARVSSPVHYLVGSARRLDLAPPAAFLATGSALLGQALLEPPSVKGWDEGPAWITTASLILRGNLAGAMLGVLEQDFPSTSATHEQGHAAEPERGDEPPYAPSAVEGPPGNMRSVRRLRHDDRIQEAGRAVRGSFARVVGVLERLRYRPRLNLSIRVASSRAASDEEIVRWLAAELLAIEPPAETVTMLKEEFRRQREARGWEEGSLLGGRVDPEPLLRRLAHLILSLPEAQLE